MAKLDSPTSNPYDVPRHLVTREMLWAEIERLRAQLFEARNDVDRLHDIMRGERPADETSPSPQAPIARLIVPDGVAGGAPLQVELYEPGLPPGEHDLYCEPTDRVPAMKASEDTK